MAYFKKKSLFSPHAVLEVRAYVRKTLASSLTVKIHFSEVRTVSM